MKALHGYGVLDQKMKKSRELSYPEVERIIYLNKVINVLRTRSAPPATLYSVFYSPSQTDINNYSFNCWPLYSHLMRQPDFCDKFNYMLWSCKSKKVFEVNWKAMLAECNVGEDSWLQRLYPLRYKWSPAFSTDTFSCNIKSTQRGESANRVFSEKTCQATTLVEFIELYDQKVMKVRDAESLLDTRTRGRPRVNFPDCGLLEHAATVYTRTIYGKFLTEMLQCLSDWVVDVASKDGYDRYTMFKQGTVERFIVICQPANDFVVCSCHMFETMGLLCCHDLRVLHSCLRLQSIPERYILKRWTKKAKQGTMYEGLSVNTGGVKTTVTTRLNVLLKESFAVMSMAAENDLTVKIALNHLSVAREEIVRCQNSMFETADDSRLPNVESSNKFTESTVLDPVNKRRKGQKNVRLKSCIEKNKRRAASRGKGVTEDSRIDVGQVASMAYPIPITVEDLEVEMFDSPSISFSQLISQMSEGGIYSNKNVENMIPTEGCSGVGYNYSPC